MRFPESQTTQPPIVLTIAGSDSSGGAGIQADLSVFHALGIYGATAITAVTVQNSKGVHGLHPIPSDVVAAQIEALFENTKPAAVKTGMLVSEEIAHRTARILSDKKINNLVIDPVIASSSGRTLLSDKGVEVLKEELIPIAKIVTPNYAEAERLTGVVLRTDDHVIEAAQHLLVMGAYSVVITGGHRADHPKDLFLGQDGGIHWLEGEFAGPDIHGTGCVFSAALASYLALGLSTLDAVQQAKHFVTDAIRRHFSWGDLRLLNTFSP
jgi:hydroxymethylpyrimidine kinase/phosphomethylpyrimidine kinase